MAACLWHQQNDFADTKMVVEKTRKAKCRKNLPSSSLLNAALKTPTARRVNVTKNSHFILDFT